MSSFGVLLVGWKAHKKDASSEVADVSGLAITYPPVEVGVENADRPVEKYVQRLSHGCVSRPEPRDDKPW